MSETSRSRLIEPIFELLSRQDAKLSDKALQSLNLAAYDVKDFEYRDLYDDSLFTGVLRSHGAATGLFESLDVDPLVIIEDAHAPLTEQSEYRRNYARTRERTKKMRRHRRPIRETPDRPHVLDGLTGKVKSDDLLLASIQRPAVWRAIRDNGISVNKVRRHIKHLGIIEPDIEAQKFVLGIEGNRFTFELFDIASGVKLYERTNTGDLVIPSRVSFVNPRQYQLEKEVAEFEWLINKHDVSEYDIQRFLEDHPHFLLGIEYKQLHSQLTLVRGDREDLRPDFFLEKLDGDFCDIVELKLPRSKLVVGKPNRRTFSSGVISALGQLREYRNYFDDPAHRKAFHNTYGLTAYKPRIQVVIGRKSDFLDPYERQALQEEVSHLEILTFDDILERVRNQLRLTL
ncbi:Shedu anti-phage system protein SduA domain-containing protein [Pelagibius sp.]|uniref:Shedu anti-phage system protein SduA domain-containing protein n=1 Tax=Pelagibius sp. TaxID=1931238 RepID=UPI0026315FE0|nr:Shedu anti-phage system protein SduA domain-containing protein [Pelagibius sp.]